MKNPFDAPGNWYKANLHTHTTTSDGEVDVQERVRQYREQEYDILAITDHHKTNDLSGLSTKDFLVISGMETHPNCPDGDPYHFVCLNVPHGFDCSEEPDPNARIRMVKEAGGEVIIAHPYWCGHNLNHLLPIEGAIGMEVYNGTCTKVCKGISSVHWDDLLNAGRMLPAVAVDDVHYGRDIFLGWTMIKAKHLTIKSIMEALRTGCYYASTGPLIHDTRIEDGKVLVECSPAVEVHFVSQKMVGDSFYADGGEPFTHVEFPLREAARYVRIEVVDQKGNRAWTNPFIPDRNL